ncbi:MAG: peptidylprolyl isomerase [Roseiflexaceae bacterium]|nr:peptidylprolyl isomerase [Roseiflexaceae bacterium]
MAKTFNTKDPRPAGPNIGAIIAALVVVGVFVALGFALANSGAQTAATDALPTAASMATPVAAAPEAPAVVPTSNRRPLPAETEVAPEVAARNEKYTAAPPMAIDVNKTYTATITTPGGDVQVKLLPEIAPETVNNFVFLAREGFYDGTTWHRVLEGFMAQGGDPTGTGTGGPGYSIVGEVENNPAFDKPGLLAMANSGSPDTAGSQFFITTAPATYLNGGYTVFGEVTSGQELIDAIPLRDPQTGPTTLGEQLTKVTISEQ